MNELTIINNGQVVTSSLIVAQEFDKNHKHVLEAIDQIMGSAENTATLFQESTYIHPQNNQEYRMFYMNRDGFSLLAMGFTGSKALTFKVEFIQAFNKMEKQIKQQMDISNLPPELQLMNALVQQMNTQALNQLKLETSIKETKAEMQEIREVIEIKPFDNWREDTNKQISKMCHGFGDYKDTRTKIYEALDMRAGTKIKTRLDNMRARALVSGMTRSKVDALGYLDVIAEDKKLIEIYTAIVKEMAIKKGVA